MQAGGAVKNSLKLFGSHGSQPTRSVLMLFKEANIPYEFVLIDPAKGETRKPAYKAIIPSGYVPAIKEEDGYVLSESPAIMAYMCDKYSLPLWYPTDLRARTNVNFWLHWNHRNTRSGTMSLLVKKLFPQKDQPLDPILAAGRKEFARSAAFIEQHLTSYKTKFLTSNKHPTIADLSIITELDQLGSRAFDIFDYTPYPKIQEYMKTVENSVPSYNELFQKVIESSQKFKK